MHDDFSALDLLSVGGFRPTPSSPESQKKKRFGGKGKAIAKSGPKTKKHGLKALLPMIGKRAHPQQPQARALQGWPVTLSWPTREFTLPDLWADQLDRPAS